MNESSAEVVQRYYEAWGRGDIASLRPWLAPDLVVRGPMMRCDDADTFVEASQRNAQRFAGSTYEPRTRVVQEDRVVVIGELCMGPVRLPTAEYFRVADGKIREIQLFFDRAALGGGEGG